MSAPTVFDAVVDAFAAVLGAAPAVCQSIATDEVDEVPADTTQAIEITGLDASPLVLGGIEGNPVDWELRVRVGLYARKSGANAGPDVGALLAAAYARLAANRNLGLGDDVYISEPAIGFGVDRKAQRLASRDLIYTVRCRTGSNSLEN
ncbi:hypothetical protein P3G55_18870 [Leptospira sp. 96542]|nr:hypothetical protein [Leptospira sp. 96542]